MSRANTRERPPRTWACIRNQHSACLDPGDCICRCHQNACYDCGKPETENTGGLNTHELDHYTIALCDECLRQREEDESEEQS